MSEKHIVRGHPIVFSLLVFFSFIELVQTAVLVGEYNSSGYPSSAIMNQERFLVFVSLWSFVLGIVYIVGFARAKGSFLFSIASHAVFLFLTWLFWLAAAGAITHTLGGTLRCSSVPDLPHCNQLNSSEAFAWICWIITTVALAAVTYSGAQSARSGNGFGGPLNTV